MLPSACGLEQHFQDLGHSFSLYGPPNRQITHIYLINYAILAWGSACKTHIDKIQTKQNHSARLNFFATAYGEHTENALPLLNLLDVLTLHILFTDFRF